jgi:dTDP-4-amino-4,6-dideoxygalactose transaminase
MQRIVYAEWGWPEYREVLGCQLRGRQNKGDELGEMIGKFEEFYPQSTLLPVNRGRVALKLALRVFAKLEPHKTEVVYPAYVCSSVIEMIEEAGLVPVPADIGEDLNLGVTDVERAVTKKTLAVVVVHMYGCPAPVTPLEQFCREQQIFLIDDAATLVGILGPRGRVLGGFGDAGLISFTASKSIVAGGFNAGGLLVVNNPDLVAAMQREWAGLPEPRFSIGDFLTFLRDQQLEPYAQSATYYYSAIHRRLFRESGGGRACPPRRMANVNAVVIIRQLQSLDERIAGRTRVAESFGHRIAAIPGVSFPQYHPGRYLTRVVLLLPEGVEISSSRAALSRRGIGTRCGYELDFRYGSSFRKAKQIAPRLLEMPSHSRLTDAEIERTCAALAAVIEPGGTRKRWSSTARSALARVAGHRS